MAQPTNTLDKLIVVLGTAVVDFLAYVPSYPKPDEKIRTEELKIVTGGNALNASCAISRFGVHTRLVTCLGSDPNASVIWDVCKSLQIDTSKIISSQKNTPFSYIVVDKKAHTRTIIHTPGEELTPSSISQSILDQASLLYLDGRHASAALQAAQWATEKEIPILFDLEREHGMSTYTVPTLLQLCSVIVISGGYAQSQSNILESILNSLSSKAKFIIITFGEKGSLFFSLNKTDGATATFDTLSDLIQFIRSKDPLLMAEWTQQPLTRYHIRISEKLEVLWCPAYPLKPEEVINTTGAGDVFIGSIAVSFLRHYSPTRMLKLASWMAATKCTQPTSPAHGLPDITAITSFLQYV